MNRKYLELSCYAAIAYVIVVLVNTLVTFSWQRNHAELIRGMVRVVGVLCLAYGVWKEEKWSLRIFYGGSLLLATLSSLMVVAFVRPNIFAGRPYPIFDYVMVSLMPIALIASFTFIWLAKRKRLGRENALL